MTHALVINSSAAGDNSVSNQLTDALLQRWRAADPTLQVTVRDLGRTPPPHLTPDRLPGLAAVDAGPDARATTDLSETFIGELRAADVLVIGAPMYNFGISSSLKAWFDHVLRAGVTFRYSATGPEGLLTGKRAIVVETRGGFYSEGAASVMDAQEPHLRTMLGFVGITDVTFVRAERLAISPDARSQAIDAALEQLNGLADARFAAAA